MTYITGKIVRELPPLAFFDKMFPYLCKDISGIEGVTALANRNRYISVFPNPALVQGYEHSNNDKQVGPQSYTVKWFTYHS